MKEVYQVLSSMLGQEARIAQISNNLANVNTVGFKKDGLAFEDYMKLAQTADPTATPTDPSAAPSAASANPAWPIASKGYTDFSMGALRSTGQPLDLAIQGEGFFQVSVDGANGPLYTRAGNFTLDSANQVVTADGHPVLDENGRPITLSPNQGPPEVTGDGMIRQGGADVARLGVVRFQDSQRLLKYGGGLFQAPGGVSAGPIDTPSVRAGYLEDSNVNPIREMVDMIQTQRAYDVNQKAMQAIDDITRERIQAING